MHRNRGWRMALCASAPKTLFLAITAEASCAEPLAAIVGWALVPTRIMHTNNGTGNSPTDANHAPWPLPPSPRLTQ